MQFNRTIGLLSSSSSTPVASSTTLSLQDRIEPHPGIKRSFSQQGQALARSSPSVPPPPPVKLPRTTDSLGKPSSFSAARDDKGKDRMASPSQGKKKQPNQPHTSTVPPSAPSGPSSSRNTAVKARGGIGKRGKGRQPPPKEPPPPKNLLEGPFRDEAFIEREHNPTGVALTGIKEGAKSPLNNFYALVKHKTPDYISKPGSMIIGNSVQSVWRCVFRLLYLTWLLNSILLVGQRSKL